MDPVRPRRRRPRWYVEVVALAGGYLLFGLMRAVIDRGEPAATGNALLVQRLERSLHLAVEYPLNQAMLGHSAAIHAAGYFYRLCVLAVPVILVWLFVFRPERYRYLRLVLVLVTLADLPLVWLYPEAPPRFALNGIVDYMAAYDIMHGAASRDFGSGINLLAAMPSMHVAWTTWCAYAVWSALRRSSPRSAWLAWLFPLLTGLVVLVTGHHYVLDILAGVALVAATVRLTGRFRHASAAGAQPVAREVELGWRSGAPE